MIYVLLALPFIPLICVVLYAVTLVTFWLVAPFILQAMVWIVSGIIALARKLVLALTRALA
jgi:hypothetical protein